MDVFSKINQLKSNPAVACTRPWTSLEERSLDGDYRICCFINKNLGILKKDSERSILDLWNGTEIKEIRNVFAESRFKSLCPRDCPLLIYKTKINTGYTDFYNYDPAEYETFNSKFKDNREKVIDAILNNEVSPPIYPLRLKLHPSNTCNLNCRMCMQNKNLRVNIGSKYYENTFKLMPCLEELVIFGGEPFACKVTKEIIFGDEIKKYPQIHYSTLTNGTLLDEKIQEKLKGLRLGSFSFSLDSCTEKIYEYIRQNARFTRTMNNLVSFVKKRDKGEISIRDIEVNFAIQKVNYKEIAKFVEFAHSLNIKCGFSFVTGSYELNDKIDNVKENIEEAIKVANSLNETETSKHLSYLLSELPIYGKKIKKLHFFYNALNMIDKDKAIFFFRRHNTLRRLFKKVLNIS